MTSRRVITSSWYFSISSLFGKIQLSLCGTLHTHLLWLCLTCFLNWKFISRVRFEEAKDIKQENDAATSHSIKIQIGFNGNFCDEIILKKINTSLVYFCLEINTLSFYRFWTHSVCVCVCVCVCTHTYNG